jgi:uncharacterized protein YycO
MPVRSVNYFGSYLQRFLGVVVAVVILLLIAGCADRSAAQKQSGPSKVGQDKRGELQEGDILFQVSRSGQGAAIQAATRSPYSHCGIFFQDSGKSFVLEAVQPVRITPLEKWISQGDGRHYVAKRLKNAEMVLTPAVIQQMKKEGKKHIGKKYDFTFQWSDDRIYCSELVWKVYARATQIELASLDLFSDFDLSGELTRKILRDRFGDDIPLDEKAISPGKIFESDKLKTILTVN